MAGATGGCIEDVQVFKNYHMKLPQGLLRRFSVHIVNWTRAKPRLHLLSVSFNS